MGDYVVFFAWSIYRFVQEPLVCRSMHIVILILQASISLAAYLVCVCVWLWNFHCFLVTYYDIVWYLIQFQSS